MRWKRLVAGLGIVAVLTAASGALAAQYWFQQPVRTVYTRLVDSQLWWFEPRYPSAWPLWKLVRLFRVEPSTGIVPTGRAAGSADVAAFPWGLAGPTAGPAPSGGLRQITVRTAQDLDAAIRLARAGDVITLAPGQYDMSSWYVPATASGTRKAPIIVRAARLGDVTVRFGPLPMGAVEGFQVSGSYWTFENLVVEGTCTSHDLCEHGFHVIGSGKGAVIRNNVVRNFNSAIKINRVGADSPDGGLIAHNYLGNDTARQTANPVTVIDLVGASYWTVRRNIIADFAKAGGDQVSYAGFFKGAGARSTFEHNLVLCSLTHKGGARVGLSLGGGGTAEQFRCAGRNRCDFEYDAGVIRGNIIADCSDVGIYLNKAVNADIANNTLIRTSGIDARYPETSARVRRNVLDGRIAQRDGGKATPSDNLVSVWRAALLMPVTGSVYSINARRQLTVADKAALKAKSSDGLPPSDWCGVAATVTGPYRGAIAPQSSCPVSLGP